MTSKRFLIRMKYYFKIACLVVMSLFVLTSCKAQQSEQTRPNIIFIMADDLGWQDTPLNKVGDASPWETPNMESLAAGGAMFTQAYSPAPTCAPSRAAMLSGRHPVKTKVTQVSGAMSDWTSGGMAVIGLGIAGGPATGIFGLAVGGAMMFIGYFGE